MIGSTLIAPAALADTIHLKNGSVIKGKVASYGDDQFVVVLDTGSSRYMSRAMIFIGDVARIEFDSAPTITSENTTPRESVDSSSARETSREPAPIVISPRESQQPETVGRNTKTADPPRETPPAETQPVSSVSREPVKEPEASSTTATDPGEAAPPPRKLTGPVKTVNVDVAAKRDWTSTGLIVKRGDRIRITANGSITMDRASQQTSGPEGTDLPDTRKLMSDRPTGALIGVIGADNDDFIFVGRSAEFTATRDGLLFLSVNEGALADNNGMYKATIEVQPQGGRKL
jgi:hypothetical protein